MNEEFDFCVITNTGKTIIQGRCDPQKFRGVGDIFIQGNIKYKIIKKEVYPEGYELLDFIPQKPRIFKFTVVKVE